MAHYPPPTDEELTELLYRTSTNRSRPGYISVNGTILPRRFPKFQEEIKNFQVRDSDVWVLGFPKTGTTWLSEIVWLLSHDLDYEGANEPDYYRTHVIDMMYLFDTEADKIWDETELVVDSINLAKNAKDPRCTKTHLPFFLLPEQIQNGSTKAKAIYTWRNPMDVCVSYYYQCVNFEYYKGTFEEFSKLFLYGKINFGPYYKHVESFLKHQTNANILIITYEEMKNDLMGVLRKIAKYLEKDLTDDQFLKLKNHVSFDTMKNNPAVNKEEIIKQVEASGVKVVAPFIREGKIGGHKSLMSDECVEKYKYYMQQWTQKTGIQFS